MTVYCKRKKGDEDDDVGKKENRKASSSSRLDTCKHSFQARTDGQFLLDTSREDGRTDNQPQPRPMLLSCKCNTRNGFRGRVPMCAPRGQRRPDRTPLLLLQMSNPPPQKINEKGPERTQCQTSFYLSNCKGSQLEMVPCRKRGLGKGGF